MKPWELFNRGVGCLSLFITLCIGFALGYALCAFNDWNRPYIDRQTAIQYGLENAQGFCRDSVAKRPIDCVHFRVTNVDERNFGWGMDFTSVDGRRTYSMIIGRRGEYDGTGGSDLDDPNLRSSSTDIGESPASRSSSVR